MKERNRLINSVVCFFKSPVFQFLFFSASRENSLWNGSAAVGNNATAFDLKPMKALSDNSNNEQTNKNKLSNNQSINHKTRHRIIHNICNALCLNERTIVCIALLPYCMMICIRDSIPCQLKIVLIIVNYIYLHPSSRKEGGQLIHRKHHQLHKN